MTGKAWKHQVLHIKLANLHWQWRAGIIYLNIFYLKCLWEGIKTPNFAHKIGGSWLPGVGRPNVFKYLKCLWQRIKISSFAHRSGESALAGAGRNNIAEYLLFEMLFEGIKTPHFAYYIVESGILYLNTFHSFGKTSKHQVLQIKWENLIFQRWAGIIYLNIFYLMWLWEGI